MASPPTATRAGGGGPLVERKARRVAVVRVAALPARRDALHIAREQRLNPNVAALPDPRQGPGIRHVVRGEELPKVLAVRRLHLTGPAGSGRPM